MRKKPRNAEIRISRFRQQAGPTGRGAWRGGVASAAPPAFSEGVSTGDGVRIRRRRWPFWWPFRREFGGPGGPAGVQISATASSLIGRFRVGRRSSDIREKSPNSRILGLRNFGDASGGGLQPLGGAFSAFPSAVLQRTFGQKRVRNSAARAGGAQISGILAHQSADFGPASGSASFAKNVRESEGSDFEISRAVR